MKNKGFETQFINSKDINAINETYGYPDILNDYKMRAGKINTLRILFINVYKWENVGEWRGESQNCQ